MTEPSLILILTPGGLENGGGIGRLIGYMLSSWPDRPRPPVRVIDTRGPKTILAWPIFMGLCILRIVAALPRRPLLHIHLASGGSTYRKIVLVKIGRLLGLKMLIHLHDPDYGAFFLRLPGWVRARIRSMFLSVDRVVVLGKAAEAAITGIIGVPAARVEIVHNAVPMPTGLASAGGDVEPRILFLGNLSRRKGVHDLIAALAHPSVRALSWRATLAGGGPDQPGFEAQAAEAGIGERVRFPGWVDQKETQRLLLDAQILVLPSYAEGMAMSVLEGLACGLCVISTPVGALAEVVEDGVNALAVTPGDVEGLAAALARCLSDPALRGRLGLGARQAFLSRYNIADYPDRMLAVFRRALGRA